MSQSLDEWIETHASKYKHYDMKKLSDICFFREEIRPVFITPNKFYSPADGLIISQQIVKPHEKIMEVKGQKYTLENILPGVDLDEDVNYAVVEVFMSFYDVHVNRVPYGGFLKFRETEPLQSYNMPMIAMENRIFSDHIAYKHYNDGYLFNNSRMINTFFNNKKNLKYWVVQIADSDVSTFTHFTIHQNEYFDQGDRFSFIRWGSQCDLIVPMDQYKFKFLQKPLYHVKGAEDFLLEFV